MYITYTYILIRKSAVARSSTISNIVLNSGTNRFLTGSVLYRVPGGPPVLLLVFIQYDILLCRTCTGQ